MLAFLYQRRWHHLHQTHRAADQKRLSSMKIVIFYYSLDVECNQPLFVQTSWTQAHGGNWTYNVIQYYSTSCNNTISTSQRNKTYKGLRKCSE